MADTMRSCRCKDQLKQQVCNDQELEQSEPKPRPQNQNGKLLKLQSGGGGVRVLRLTNSYGHMETGPQFKVSSERLEKPGIEITTPGLEGNWLNPYTTEATRITK